MNGKVIDADGHVFEPQEELQDYLEGKYRGLRRLSTFPLLPSIDGWPRGFISPLAAPGVEVSDWLAFMDEAGIETAVLYPSAGLAIGLIQNPEWACAMARAYNNWLHARFLANSPRLKGVALLPVQDPFEAAGELRRAVGEQGMVGGLLPAVTVLNKALGHSDFYPIFHQAQELDVPLAIHGAPSRGMGFDFYDNFVKTHALEHPVALMIQFTSIVMDGILELFPRVRIAFLEAGCGWLPYMMDRLDYEYEAVWGKEASLLQKPPSEYIRGGSVYVTCEVEERLLPTAVELLGADYVMYPSDFPHERAREEFALDIPKLRGRSDLSQEVKEKILYRNAARFYRL